MSAAQQTVTGYIAVENTFSQEDLSMVGVYMGIDKSLSGRCSASLFSWVDERWAEAYVGPTCRIVPQLSLTLFAGVQHDRGQFDLQLATQIDLSTPVLDLYVFVEGNQKVANDPTLLWYDVALTRQFHQVFSMGVKTRSVTGTGLVMSFYLPAAVSVHAAWLPMGAQELSFEPARTLVWLMWEL